MKHSHETDSQTKRLDVNGPIFSMAELASALDEIDLAQACIFTFFSAEETSLGPHFAHKLDADYHNDIAQLYNSMTDDNKVKLVERLYNLVILLFSGAEDKRHTIANLDAIAEIIQERATGLSILGYDKYSNPVSKVKNALIKLQNQ